MRKILLSSIFQPLGPKHGDAQAVSAELFHGQITIAQGLFCPRTTLPHFPLDYIAHNLDTPAVVLQYPKLKDFVKELRNGYEFVGITFNLCTFHKVKKMVALVRKHAPQAKVILGGYGTVLNDETLKPHADFICRSEGVQFIREVLGEAPKPMPYDHPLVSIELKAMSIPMGKNAIIFGGLGCPNGCDFCATSHYFKQQHIRLLPEPEDMWAVIKRHRAVDPNVTFTVFDEEFLSNERWSRRFLEIVRSSGEPPPNLFVLSSIRSIVKFEVEELVEMGISLMWIGYEAKASDYAKKNGADPKELFLKLKANGIMVLASYIMGFEYHTKENIRAEVDEIIALNLPYYQFLIYGATPGTPLYERVIKDELFRPEIIANPDEYYKICTGFYSMSKHPSLQANDLEEIQQECYRSEFEKLGPSLVRGMECWLNGYKKFKDHPSKVSRLVAQSHRKNLLQALPILLTARLLGPTAQTRARALALCEEIHCALGIKPGMLHWLQSSFVLAAACWTWFTIKMGWGEQPTAMRHLYREMGKGTHDCPLS